MFIVLLVTISAPLNLMLFLFCEVLLNLAKSCTGDLFHVTKPPPYSFLTVSPFIWHQHCGHPVHHVLNHLFDSRFIHCTDNKISSLCQAIQLGKHSKLPSSLSNLVMHFPFQTIHTDFWTSLHHDY